TWGYTLTNLGDNPSQSTLSSTTFSKVELTSSSADSLISSGSKTTGAGDNLPVTYGFMADTKLTPGTYSTQVTYTAIAETPSYTISSVSPSELYTNDQTDKQITILTTTPASELGLGDITAKITNAPSTSAETSTNTVVLTNCTEITQEVSGVSYRGAQCSYSGSLVYGTYNVVLTSSWHSSTYTLVNGFNIRDSRTMSNITYMQEMNPDICMNSTNKQTANLLDTRGQGDNGSDTTSTYRVIKAIGNVNDPNSECWMTTNLNIYNKTITNQDSNITATSYTIPNTSDSATYTAPTVHVTTNASYAGTVYYNWAATTALQNSLSATSKQTQSICPKNWIIPANGDSSVAKSWAHLLSTYNITTAEEAYANSMLGLNKLTGYWNQEGREGGQDFHTVFWSSIPETEDIYLAYNFQYYVNVTNSFFSTTMSNSKALGATVRCVAR
ncbi:hypothetical protein IKG16_03135, partial [Candidatus Saccharibacteria bacterium]|nr:hypothetical protein [Candidatus Saccharibacteria bacterium]